MTRRGCLPLPVADAAGFARPGLDPRIHRLRTERVAMAVDEPRRCRAAPCLVRDVGDPVRRPDGMDRNPLRLDLESFTRPGGLAAAITLGFDGYRGERRGGSERRLRKHGSGQIEVEKVAGAIVGRRCAAGYEHRGKNGWNQAFQDQFGLLRDAKPRSPLFCLSRRSAVRVQWPNMVE